MAGALVPGRQFAAPGAAPVAAQGPVVAGAGLQATSHASGATSLSASPAPIETWLGVVMQSGPKGQPDFTDPALPLYWVRRINTGMNDPAPDVPLAVSVHDPGNPDQLEQFWVVATNIAELDRSVSRDTVDFAQTGTHRLEAGTVVRVFATLQSTDAGETRRKYYIAPEGVGGRGGLLGIIRGFGPDLGTRDMVAGDTLITVEVADFPTRGQTQRVTCETMRYPQGTTLDTAIPFVVIGNVVPVVFGREELTDDQGADLPEVWWVKHPFMAVADCGPPGDGGDVPPPVPPREPPPPPPRKPPPPPEPPPPNPPTRQPPSYTPPTFRPPTRQPPSYTPPTFRPPTRQPPSYTQPTFPPPTRPRRSVPPPTYPPPPPPGSIPLGRTRTRTPPPPTRGFQPTPPRDSRTPGRDDGPKPCPPGFHAVIDQGLRICIPD